MDKNTRPDNTNANTQYAIQARKKLTATKNDLQKMKNMSILKFARQKMGNSKLATSLSSGYNRAKGWVAGKGSSIKSAIGAGISKVRKGMVSGASKVTSAFKKKGAATSPVATPA